MKLNTAASSATPIETQEGGRATRTDPIHELKRAVLTCLLWESNFYDKGSDVAARIASLVPQVKPEQVAALAREARDRMNLRHVPLFLVSELSKVKGAGTLVAETLAHVIQRADELSEFLAIYWKHGSRSGKPGKHPLSAGIKRGLAQAFCKFDRYKLSKWNRASKIKLRDAMFLVSPKPKDEEQAALWKQLADGTLESPPTWEVLLSAGRDKKATFEQLMRDGQLGGMALLKNLRGMLEANVDESLIRERLAQGAARAFPYRFVVAAKFAPRIEDAIEGAMFKAIEGLEALPGSTGLLIDVSGSMDYRLNTRGESRTVFQPGKVAAKEQTSRIDVAAGLAILLREKSAGVLIATFSNSVVELPPRRGFALRDSIQQSQPHGATMLRASLEELKAHFAWKDIERLIVITDEQSQDGISDAWAPKSYVINVAPNQNGVSYRNGWRHIDGWSEHCIEYIREYEALEEAPAL